MKRFVFLLLAAWPGLLPASDPPIYHWTPASDTGGGPGSSPSYRIDSSETPGGAGRSVNYDSRTGYAGQLDEAASLTIFANPSSVPETGTTQLEGRLLSTAGYLTPLAPGEMAWSILSGPVSGIDTQGLLTAAKVYQPTTASIQGATSGRTGTLDLQVLDPFPDNFGAWAGDGLPDWWQFQYLGLTEPAAGPAGDPDRDGYNNLLEFAFGTHPAQPGSGPDPVSWSNGVLLSRGQPVPLINNIPNSVDFRVVFVRRLDYLATHLRYQVQFSPDLLTWTTTSATPSRVALDLEYEALSVPWPFFLEGRKTRFFRILIDFSPTP